MYGIWAYLSTFSRVWAFIWKMGSGSRSCWKVESGSASKKNQNPDPFLDSHQGEKSIPDQMRIHNTARRALLGQIGIITKVRQVKYKNLNAYPSLAHSSGGRSWNTKVTESFSLNSPSVCTRGRPFFTFWQIMTHIMTHDTHDILRQEKKVLAFCGWGEDTYGKQKIKTKQKIIYALWCRYPNPGSRAVILKPVPDPDTTFWT